MEYNGCMPKKGFRHSEETKKQISEAKRREKGRAPLQPLPCGCGCGEYAAVDERRNRVSKFLSGHSSRVSHPMQGKHHTDEARAKLASYTGAKGSAYTHGWSGTPTYKSWNAMRSRCRDEGNASYLQYGGRGITVCERWETSFENFLEDMGARPSLDYEIDREDPDGNYEKANCRWITRAENQARKRSSWPARRAKSAERIERVLLSVQLEEAGGDAKGATAEPSS